MYKSILVAYAFSVLAFLNNLRVKGLIVTHKSNSVENTWASRTNVGHVEGCDNVHVCQQEAIWNSHLLCICS